MKVLIGERIKELRKRDSRKQEDLATAIGVTPQAVSRWEAGTCYPDMGMLPAIANYFHVSIDSLFGYQNDREKKIQEYVLEANRRIFDYEDSAETIRFLRKCLEEFPAEPKLQSALACILQFKGRCEEEKRNPYLEEAAALYEELSKQDNDQVGPLLQTYVWMGEYDKAAERAKLQPRVEMSMEVLLATLFVDERGAQYRGEAILVLLHVLGIITKEAIITNDVLRKSEKGIEILTTVIDLYDRIFEGKDFGFYHSDLCMLNLRCAQIAIRIKEYDMSVAFLEQAYVHYEEYHKVMAIAVQGIPRESHYTAPLLSEAKGGLVGIVNCEAKFFKNTIDGYPAKLKAKLKKDPRFAALY